MPHLKDKHLEKAWKHLFLGSPGHDSLPTGDMNLLSQNHGRLELEDTQKTRTQRVICPVLLWVHSQDWNPTQKHIFFLRGNWTWKRRAIAKMEVKVQNKEATAVLHAWGRFCSDCKLKHQRVYPVLDAPMIWVECELPGRQEGWFKQKQNKPAPSLVLKPLHRIWQWEQPWHRTTEHIWAPSSLFCIPFPKSTSPL